MITRSLRDTIQIDFPDVLIYSPFFCNHRNHRSVWCFDASDKQDLYEYGKYVRFYQSTSMLQMLQIQEEKKKLKISQLLQTMVNHIIITGVKQQMIVTTELTALQKLRV